jgi:hypothetical protein
MAMSALHEGRVIVAERGRNLKQARHGDRPVLLHAARRVDSQNL